MNVLEIDQLRKTLPGLKLDIARMDVREGEFAALLGEEKAGKSTLFKLMLDMLFTDFGSIKICELDSRTGSEEIKQLMAVVARRPGLLYQAKMKAIKNMLRPFFRQWDEALYRSYLHDFEVDDSFIYGRVDNDTKKQFVVALALARRPRLLLMNQPFNQVSKQARENIAQALWREQRERGLSLLLATTVPEEAARLADTLHILHQGSLRLSLPMENLAGQAAGLDWQGREKRSRDQAMAQKIAQTEALYAHYTREGGREA